MEEESVEGSLADELDASVEGAEMKFTLRDGNKESVESSILPVKSGTPSRNDRAQMLIAVPNLPSPGWVQTSNDIQEEGLEGLETRLVPGR